MPIKPQTARTFERTSPVARYWLAQCEGFRVNGAVKGTVEQVVAAPDLQNAQQLVVRTRGRRRHVSVDTVEAVVPAERLIVVEPARLEPRPTRARRRPRTIPAVVHGLRTVAHTTANAFVGVARFALGVVVQSARVLADDGVRPRSRDGRGFRGP
jgi:hypothetical protein